MNLELKTLTESLKGFLFNKYNDELGGVHYIFRFPNGYGASVVKGRWTYGGLKDLWEMGLIFFEENGGWDLTYERDFDDDVKGYLTDDDVIELLEKIKRY